MRWFFGCLFGLFSAGAAFGQPYQIQQGNVLDVNPQYGSAGINTQGRQYQINAGNRIVTGNVTGGAGFRGFSPISDPSAFGLSRSSLLPSDQISNFSRDTFSVGDIASGRNLPYATSPYYSPSSTVVNTGGIVRGLNRPGTSQVQTPYVSPRIDLRSGIEPPSDIRPGTGLLQISPRIERLDSGQVVSGPINQRLLASPLFGAVRAVPADVLAAQASQSASLGANLAAPIDGRLQPAAPLDQREPVSTPTIQPDAAAGQLATDRPDQRPSPRPLVSSAKPEFNRLPADNRLDARAPARAAEGPPADTFAAMREMTGELLQPIEPAPTLAEAAQQDETRRLARPLRPEAAAPADRAEPPARAGRPPLEMGPLRSFVGTEQSTLNRYLSRAEAALRSGKYYNAENLYELARTIAPDNPLPLLGRSLALLAAGEYVSSVNSLIRAIELYENLAQFPVDLPSFVPDVTMLDRRRADLERRLEASDDYRLRFLLGYAEYSSGLHQLGLQNMRRAAQAAPPELASLERFVASLARLTPPATRPGR